MPKERMLWSLDGLSSVRASKLREFRVDGWNTFDGNHFRLTGLFNKNETFEFGIFNTSEEALEFLNGIHNIIEGGK